MGIYNRVKYYSLGKPYWDIDVIPPSPDEENYSYKFIINTEILTPGDNEYTIPKFTTTNGLINVDWGDGNTDKDVSTLINHTYSSAGVYTIKLYTNIGHKITGIYHIGYIPDVEPPPLNFDNAKKVIELVDWGDGISNWETFFYHFGECENLTGMTTNSPILNDIDSRFIFYNCLNFNVDISSWDISNVFNMSATFYNATSFNQDISSWNTSSMQTMSYLFYSATSFNQNISSWDTSNLYSATAMFENASSFNQDLSSWNISSLQVVWIIEILL